MVTVVTGSSGFLGSHVLACFRDLGRVVGLGRPEVEIPSAAFREAFVDAAPSLVVHCAGPASVPESVADPERDRAGAVDVLVSLLELADSRPERPRLLLVSSAAVYGEPETFPVSETAERRPVSPYGRHRVEAEDLARSSGVPVAIARIFSAYGRGLRRQLLWDVANRAVDGDALRLHGTGRESRDFIHAKDAARALACIALGSDFGGEAINVASGKETTVADAAGALLGHLRVDSRILFDGTTRAGDPTRWMADITRLRSLGFEQRITLDEGIADYASWFLDLRR